MDRNEAREKIVRVATEEILTKGYSNVTMDAISAVMKMSKKTIYQLFPGKRDLLRTVLSRLQKEIEEGISQRVDAVEMGFRDRWRAVLEYIGIQYARFGPGFVEDLHTVEPEIYAALDTFRTGLVRTHFARLAAEGTREGVFRKEIDPRLISAVYQASLQAILNPATVQELGVTPAQAYRDMVKLLFEGILEPVKPG